MTLVRKESPVPWVSAVVYGIVLLAGLYYVLAGLGGDVHPFRTAGFVVGVAALFALEPAERRFGAGRGTALAFLLVRLSLFVAVAALDDSGLSRALFVLVPFAAYLAFGRTVSIALGALCLVLLVVSYALWVPGWYTSANYVADVLMFVIGLVLAIAMAGIAVREQQARSRLEESLREVTSYAAQVADLSAAAERNRLARDIHDSLGHHLTAIAVQVEKASAFRDRDPRAADQALADARSSARRALDEVRRSVGALRDEREGHTLSASLAELVDEAGDDQLQVSLAVDGEERTVDNATVSALFRAAQEALTNARRHAQAERVSVSLTFAETETRLVVADDGRGFGTGATESGEGFGLLGLRERAALVGGLARVESRPGAGTRITVTVPCGKVPAR
ncbi:sensor histidine kinase [Amycolatopsis sp. lyj-112]|uniref:sensor histidine kinase n=1 Tax=Amycolatopsis sp. lyj-112 TaxID=2789288 RepID=UPI003979A52E